MRALLVLVLLSATAVSAERLARFHSPMYFLPPVKAIVITKSGAPGPGSPKHETIASIATLKDEAKLPNGGPYDVWLVPKDGRPIQVLGDFKPKDGLNDIKLNDLVGVINFRGDGQPRGSLLVTPQGDDGPEVKGHKVVQTAGDTRSELVVPPGDYAIWVVPESGARARRVNDKVRVLAGKTVTIE